MYINVGNDLTWHVYENLSISCLSINCLSINCLSILLFFRYTVRSIKNPFDKKSVRYIVRSICGLSISSLSIFGLSIFGLSIKRLSINSPVTVHIDTKADYGIQLFELNIMTYLHLS